MNRHFHHSSRGSDHHTWTHFPGPETSQELAPISQATSTSFPLVPTTTSSFSSLQQLTLLLCGPSSMSTGIALSLPLPLAFSPSIVQSLQQPSSIAISQTLPSPMLQTPTSSFQSSPTKVISPTTSSQTLATSTVPEKVLAAGFSSTSTSTVLDIITTSSPPQSPPSLFIPTAPLPLPKQQSNFISRMSTDAKVGALLGLIIFGIFLLVLVLFLFTRKKRRVACYPPSDSQRPLSYARETEPLTASTPEPYMGIEVIPASEPKTRMDAAGIRWPESVVLRGDAKEIREWTEEYGRTKGEDEKRVLESYGFWRGKS